MTDTDLFGNDRPSPIARNVPGLLPWQQQTWSLLAGDVGRVPHALLLSGPSGLGKSAFSRRFAQFLLCLSPTGGHDPCGHCKSCNLFAAKTHPDLAWIAPAEAGRAVTVDQIRDLNVFLTLKPHTSPCKVVVIEPADAMNINAANSLLKQLEEPPLGSILLLVTSAPHRLPATIRSRCSRMDFTPPADAEAMAFLEQAGVPRDQGDILLALAGGAPLRASVLGEEDILSMREALLSDLESLRGRRGEIVSCASRWKELGVARTLAWLQQAVSDIIKLATGGVAKKDLANRDLVGRLQACGKDIQLKDLFTFLDQVSRARALLPGPLDEQLMIESLLIHWSRLAR